MSRHVEVTAEPGNVQWGHYDAAVPPIVTIQSGDTVTMTTLSGAPDQLPEANSGFTLLPFHLDVLRTTPRGPGPHLLTGPVAVEGAEIGDSLRVDILDVKLRQDWGYNLIRPLAGTLPEDFPTERLLHIGIDTARNIIHMPWGLDVPAAPFFGCMGTAPPAAWGRQTSVMPRAFGGNIDCKDLVAGTTLHLPVWCSGGMFSVGDGHAAQGHGEVCLTAIETSLSGTFRIALEKQTKLSGPWAETPTHIITLGFDEDLDDAAKKALRAMIQHIVAVAELSDEDAYTLCSVAADLHVTQLVNGQKGIHAMLPRWALKRK